MLIWGARSLRASAREPAGGSLIVLAGEQDTDGAIGAASLARCIHAAETFRQGRFGIILVTGGASNYLSRPGPRLAELMARRLECLGVPAEAIAVDAASRNTRQSAQCSARLLRRQQGPFTLITSDYHSYRAARCFVRAGIEVESWPVDDVARRLQAGDRQDLVSCGAILLEEACKVVHYRWKGWL